MDQHQIAWRQDFELEPGGWASTIDSKQGAGFYSSYWGPLPYVIGRTPAERYTLLQFSDSAHVSANRGLPTIFAAQSK